MTKVWFILGPTACGKGAVGREIAKRIDGQIVSVDSMKVYRRMDIGTGKPSPKMRSEVPHHCIDIVEPGEGFSVGRFVRQADAAIEEISLAGSVPLAVGGTNLYVKALTEGLFDGPAADPKIRSSLKAQAKEEGIAALHAALARLDPVSAERIGTNDAKRIIRALEVYRSTGRPISELQKQWDTLRRYECVFIGLRREREDLHHRINARAKRMIESGLREEVESLLAEPAGLSMQAAAAIGYAEMIEHLQGEMTLAETLERIKINTRRMAKRQRTWQRRMADVLWFDVFANDSAGSVADRICQKVEFFIK